MRYVQGDVPEQSRTFVPSIAEFVQEARRQQEVAAMRKRPALPPPVYRSGPIPPFMMARQKLLAENAHLPALFEDINFDQFKRLSKERQIPVGAKWVAALGTVYGPKPKHSIELAAE